MIADHERDFGLPHQHEGGQTDIDLVTKPGKKMNIGIVGYGPAGITAAIGLTRQGHQVTIFEKSFYDYRNVADRSTENKTLMYPVNIGAKGM